MKFQRHGLKVHLRDPNSFTPMWEGPSATTGLPRSLLIGSDHKLTHQQIAQFSQKDADVSYLLDVCMQPLQQYICVYLCVVTFCCLSIALTSPLHCSHVPIAASPLHRVSVTFYYSISHYIMLTCDTLQYKWGIIFTYLLYITLVYKNWWLTMCCVVWCCVQGYGTLNVMATLCYIMLCVILVFAVVVMLCYVVLQCVAWSCVMLCLLYYVGWCQPSLI